MYSSHRMRYFIRINWLKILPDFYVNLEGEKKKKKEDGQRVERENKHNTREKKIGTLFFALLKINTADCNIWGLGVVMGEGGG